VRFCTYFQRDSIRRACEKDSGWQNYSLLYGGNSKTNETIKLYNLNVFDGKATRLSFQMLNEMGLKFNDDVPFVYLPGIDINHSA